MQGFRCLGLPTSCPAGRIVNESAQACVVRPCEGGRVQESDGVRPGESVRIPYSIAPQIDESSVVEPLELKNEMVGLHMTDTREGGGLCHGQPFRLLLELEQEMYIRVLNLYDSDEGTVIFPVMAGTDGPVPAGRPVDEERVAALIKTLKKITNCW